jgi:two-component system sensor histidine kinase BaeS
VLWSVLGLVVFGLLFGSADALFASWVSTVTPDLHVDTFVFRVFVGVAVAGLVLATSYFALQPPTVDAAGVRERRPVQRRYEWLAPVLLVDAVFVLFLVAQAAATFGGHDYLRRTTGLTYADYVHQGFGQLTVATLLTFLVVWAASRKAALDTPADRLWLGGALGLLCVLTLVVVASALHRMSLYQQAYGYTRLRLLVDAFEGWLGLCVLTVIVAGVLMKGWWLPRSALLSGAVVLLALAVGNPDATIARHNLERYHVTGKLDTGYLLGLSADAVPTVAELGLDPCRLARMVKHDDWVSWNLGRARARAALPPSDCFPGPRS